MLPWARDATHATSVAHPIPMMTVLKGAKGGKLATAMINAPSGKADDPIQSFARRVGTTSPAAKAPHTADIGMASRFVVNCGEYHP